MGFDVQGALRAGYTQEEIDAYLASKNLEAEEASETPEEEPLVTSEKEEVVETPQPKPQQPSQPKSTFDVEGALQAGYTQEQIDAYIKRKENFDVEGALQAGYTQEQIDDYLQNKAIEDEGVSFWSRWKESGKQGLENFGDIFSGYKLALADTHEEQGRLMQQMKAQEAADALSRVPTITAREIQKTFEESGLIPAGMKVPSYMVEMILQSGPQMIPPIIAAVGATALAAPLGPFAPVVGLTAGVVTYGLQQFGNFMNTQGLEFDAPEQLNEKDAAIWSAITAPAGYIADRLTLGLAKIPNAILKKEIAQELAKRLASKTATGAAIKRGVGGTALGILAEAPTEYIETYAELMQAGVDMQSPRAQEALFEAVWSAAAVGGGLGGPIQGYQGYNKFKQEQLVVNQERQQEEEIDDEVETEKTKAQIADEIVAKAKTERRVNETQKIKKTNIQDIKFDKATLNELGIKGGSTTGRTLAPLDLTTEEGLEIASNALEEQYIKGYKDLNEPAISTLRKKLKRRLTQVKKETQDANTSQRSDTEGAGTSTQVPKLKSRLDKTTTKRTKKPKRDAMVRDTRDTSGATRTIEELSNTLKNNKKNPTVNPPKVGQKIKLGRLRNNKPEVLEGTVSQDAQGNLALTYEQKSKDLKGKPAKVTVLFNEQQLINPTPNDLKGLQTLANQIKETQKRKNVILDEKQQKDEDTQMPSTKRGQFSQRKIIQDIKNTKNVGQVFEKLKTKAKDALTSSQEILLDKLSQLPNIGNTIFNVVPNLENRKDPARASGKTDQYGLYTPTLNTIQISDKADVETILHETTHAATANEIRKNIQEGTELGKRVVQLYETAKQADTNQEFVNELNDVYEFVSEAFNSPNFQRFLASVPSPNPDPRGVGTLWSDFVNAVKDILGLGDIQGSVLNDVIAVAPDLFTGPNVQEQRQARLKPLPKISTNKQKEKELDNILDKTGIRKEEKRRQELEPKDEKLVNLPMRAANYWFSFDAALQQALQKAAKAANISWDEIAKMLNMTSVSQALHADELSRMFARFGKMIYNPDKSKFEVIQDPDAPSYEKVIDKLKQIAKSQGISLDKMKSYASQAFVAKRLKSIKLEQEHLEIQARDLVNQGKEPAARKLLKENLKIVHLSTQEIDTALSFFDEIPGLNEVYDTWIGARDAAIDLMVEQEVLSREQAEQFKENIDYVPFYREGLSGPKDFNRGLIDNTWHEFKGSYRPVADVFDNMDKWIRYSARRSILNRIAINKIDATLKYMPNAIKEVSTRGDNTVSINRIIDSATGKTGIKTYQFGDPTYVAAFGGLESIMLPGIAFLSSVSNILRANVVLYPLFSLAQTVQDGVNAMVSYGGPLGLMIPLRVMKEFPLTLLGLSKTHKDLKRYGVVGGFGSYSQSSQQAEVDLKKPGFYNAIRRLARGNPITGLTVKALNHVAMAADNSIRQAVYEQIMMETGDAQLALESSFEIINFRRAGSGPVTTFLRQTVPFFGAALQALSVQGRVVVGKGIAPRPRAEAFRNYVSNMVQLSMLTLIYNAMMSGEEEFEELDPKIRDRRFLLGNGYYLTLRPDIHTLIAKVIPEHVYQYMVMESEDSQKMIDAIKRAAKDIFPATAVPQFFRPIQELSYNYSSALERPITPQSTENKDVSRQYTATTSEFAKMVGEASGISPLKIDYFIRQYLGYTAGLGLMLLDKMIEDSGALDYDRTTLSDRDALARIPGMSNFLAREHGNRATTDYYELKRDVDKAYDIYKDLEKNSYNQAKINEKAVEYNALIQYKKWINKTQEELSTIRKNRNRIINAPRTVMSGDEKKERLDNLYSRERQLLSEIRDIRKNVYDSGMLDIGED